MVYNRTYQYQTNSSVEVCLNIFVDGSIVQYQSQPFLNCSVIQSTASFGDTVTANVNISRSLIFAAQNPILHNWFDSDGVMGLNYCNSKPNCPTAFQHLLSNSTDVLDDKGTFALDLQPSVYLDGINSTMQIGGVSAEYAEMVQWMQQPVSDPTLHQFFMENLTFCGNGLFGNFSNNWNVVVDTGAVCLTLPGEIYDSFEVWFNTSTTVKNYTDLPSLSFSMSTFDQEKFYIPLGNLIVNSSAIDNENGAPFVSVEGVGLERLCILRGNDVVSKFGNSYNSPAPSITFGSAALSAIYFAANFQDGSTGLANKLSTATVGRLPTTDSLFCNSKTQCEGDQIYDSINNDCTEPLCSKYYFMILDDKEHVCVYSVPYFAAGLALILFIVVGEMYSFFIFQYSAANLAEQEEFSFVCRREPVGNIDGYSFLLGKCFTTITDYVLIHILRWAELPRANNILHFDDMETAAQYTRNNEI